MKIGWRNQLYDRNANVVFWYTDKKTSTRIGYYRYLNIYQENTTLYKCWGVACQWVVDIGSCFLVLTRQVRHIHDSHNAQHKSHTRSNISNINFNIIMQTTMINIFLFKNYCSLSFLKSNNTISDDYYNEVLQVYYLKT